MVETGLQKDHIHLSRVKKSDDELDPGWYCLSTSDYDPGALVAACTSTQCVVMIPHSECQLSGFRFSVAFNEAVCGPCIGSDY